MKLYTILAITLLGVLLLAVIPSVFAEDATTTVAAEAVANDNLTANPGVTPDSTMYGLKLGWEKLGILFTFNQEKKAEKELALADRKLLEVRKMADKGNEKAMERAQVEHDKLVADAQARLDAIKEDTTAVNVKADAKAMNALQAAIAAHENRIETLKDILAEKNLTDEQKAKMDTVIGNMENRTQELNDRLDSRQERLVTKLRAITNESEDQIKSEIENNSALIVVEKAIAEQRVAKTEEALSKLKDKIENLKTNGTNVSIIEARIADAEALVAQAKDLIAAGNYSEAIKVLKPVSNYGRNLSWVMHKINQARQEDKKEDVKTFLEKAKEGRVQLGENIRQNLEDFKNQTQEQRAQLGENIKSEINQFRNQTEQLREQLRNKTGL